MTDYENHRIKELKRRLEDAGIDQKVVDEIMDGGEAIRRGTKPEDKAEWMRIAMLRMNRLLDPETRHAVREACACCLGGRRLKTSRSIALENETLENRVKAANEANYVGSVGSVKR